MREVTLSKHWSPEDVIYPPGSVVSVDDETARWLESCGALRRPGDVKPARVEPEVKPAPVPEPAPDPDPEPVQESKPRVKRPAKTAPTSEWEAFLKSQGVNPKGMKKAEMIAAVS